MGIEDFDKIMQEFSDAIALEENPLKHDDIAKKFEKKIDDAEKSLESYFEDSIKESNKLLEDEQKEFEEALKKEDEKVFEIPESEEFEDEEFQGEGIEFDLINKDLEFIGNKYTMSQLKSYAKENGVKKYSRLKEEDLITLLKDFVDGY